MPRYKYFSNRLLTFIENIITGQNLSEWHTGMRAYSCRVRESIDYLKNSDDFVFDSQVRFQIVSMAFALVKFLDLSVIFQRRPTLISIVVYDMELEQLEPH